MADQSSPQQDVGPKPLSPAVRKRLQQCFERGNELSKKDKPDHDYAHTMYIECVVNDPSNLEYVEALMDNLQRKYGNNKKGARIKGFGGKSNFKKAIADEDWSDVFRLGLEILQKDPWDVPTLRALANACKANRYNEVELRYLKNALDKNPKDIDVNKHCAESLTRMGQFDQAIACWHRIETLDKKNSEAKQRISELTVAKATGVAPGMESPPAKSGTNASDSSTSLKKRDAEPVTSKEDQVELTDVERLEAIIKSGEAEFSTYEELIRLLVKDKRHRDALQHLRKGLQVMGNSDLRMKELFEDVQLDHVRTQVTIADQRSERENTQEAKDLARRFRTELNRQEIEIFAARAERYPNDINLHFELAIRLKKEGNFREAAKSFDVARAEEKYRTTALLEMGECCQQIKQYGNALKCYQSALANAEEGSAEKKRALYRAGVLAAALKNYENAKKYLSDLVKIDQNYKDASERLDKLEQIGDKG